MSRKNVGVVLLLGASELLGILLGQWFYGLFLKTVPPLVLSGFNQGAAHVAFLVYGALAGVAVFALSVIALALSRFFQDQRLASG